QWTAIEHQLQVFTSDVIHNDKVSAIRKSPESMHVHDVRMIQLSKQPRLLHELPNRPRIRLKRFAQCLHCDQSPICLPKSSVDSAHATCADKALQRVIRILQSSRGIRINDRFRRCRMPRLRVGRQLRVDFVQTRDQLRYVIWMLREELVPIWEVAVKLLNSVLLGNNVCWKSFDGAKRFTNISVIAQS